MIDFGKNRIAKLFDIQYPIIQGGMAWCSGWQLASAVSEAGGLGLIGAGSMQPEVFRTHVRKCKAATNRPFGVNVPLLYNHIDKIVDVLIEEEIKIAFTSAGNPAVWTPKLKEHGIQVIHVVSSIKFAKKAEDCGVDAIVAEGFEAGGHNGREETTTLCLIPEMRKATSLPIMAAGGIGSGQSMFAAMALGADGVQVGSRFVATPESSAHDNFKQAIVEAPIGSTLLTLKELTPVRLLKGAFFDAVREEYQRGTSKEKLRALLGKGRAKAGMFEGDLEYGELEIGQVSGSVSSIMPAGEVVAEMIREFAALKKEISEPGRFGN